MSYTNASRRSTESSGHRSGGMIAEDASSSLWSAPEMQTPLESTRPLTWAPRARRYYDAFDSPVSSSLATASASSLPRTPSAPRRSSVTTFPRLESPVSPTEHRRPKTVRNPRSIQTIAVAYVHEACLGAGLDAPVSPLENRPSRAPLSEEELNRIWQIESADHLENVGSASNIQSQNDSLGPADAQIVDMAVPRRVRRILFAHRRGTPSNGDYEAEPSASIRIGHGQ